MKLRISEFVKSPRAAYAALFCVMLACHLQFLYVPGDEVGYAAALGGNWNFASMFAYVGGHYWTWSARMLTESLFCIFSAAPVLVWRVVNPAVITACAWLMAYALQSEKKRTESWLLCALVFLHQWVNLKTAGWVVTTIAYLWLICFGLAALCPLWRLVRGKRTPAWGWVLACISLLFAANMEQPALVLPFLVAGGMLFLHARGVRVPAGLWVQLAICAASLVFIFTCPGNAMRTENDITSFYMNYPMLSVLQKAEIGISGVVHASVLGREMLFFLLAVLTAALVWAKRREWLLRAVSLVPCVLMVPLSLYQYELGGLVPWVKQLTASYTAAGYISLANCNAPAAYVPFLLSYGLYAIVLWNVYAAEGTSRAMRLCWALLALGGMSWAAMGFTPSVGVSGLRTGTLYYFFVMAACMVVHRQLPQKRRIWLWCVLAWFCLVQLHALWEV